MPAKPPALLLGSMYFWSWLIQLNRSYKYNENIARTGILTLNGHISKTKNDKNNPKVPKFSSCRGLSSTLSRKCGSTTLCGCFVGVCGCFWVFVGVRGVTICHDWLKHAPGTTWQGETKKIAASSKMTVRQQLL